jgi:hypothetical protein
MMKAGWKIITATLVLISVALLGGCGSGSGSTSGTLMANDITVTDLTGGTYSVQTSAIYAPSTGSILPGTEISYSATFAGGSTTSRSGTLYTDGTGTVVVGPWLVTQDIVPILVTITVTTGGLSSTKVISVPAMAVLAVTPQTVSFGNTDTAGSSKTVTVTGGFSPYTVSSASPGDISATVSGGTVTITKLTASGVINASTTITITDNKGFQQPVTVGYFK